MSGLHSRRHRGARAARRRRISGPKRWLMSVLAVGLIAYSGVGGTFASFTAQTTNANSTIASGTLTMSNSVNSANLCYSASSSTVNGNTVTPVGNNNANCANVVALTNVEPGSWTTSTQVATVAIKNTGSLNASNFWLEAPSTTDCVDSRTTTAPVGGATSGTGLNFNAIALDITSVTLTSGSTTATTTAAGGFTGVAVGMTITGSGVASGATVASVAGSSLTMSASATASETAETLQFGAKVASVTLTANSMAATVSSGGFPNVSAGMLVNGTGIASGTVVSAVAGNTLTLSQAASTSGTVTLTFGGNPFCQSLLMYVQESAVVGGNTYYYCWYGYGSSGATTGQSEATNDGLCDAPVTTTLNTALSANTAITSITFNAITGPIYGADSIVVTNDAGYSSTGCTVNGTHAGTVYLPTNTPTSIPVTCTSTPTQGFGTDSTIVDSTENGYLNGDTTDTVANFDTLHASSLGPIELYPINGAGTVNTLTTAAQLSAQTTRTFTVGVYLPNPVGNQNDLQGVQSSFGLTWYMSQ